jgi:hypothetical protein
MTSSHHHQLPGFFFKLISESPCIIHHKYIFFANFRVILYEKRELRMS